MSFRMLASERHVSSGGAHPTVCRPRDMQSHGHRRIWAVDVAAALRMSRKSTEVAIWSLMVASEGGGDCVRVIQPESGRKSEKAWYYYDEKISGTCKALPFPVDARSNVSFVSFGKKEFSFHGWMDERKDHELHHLPRSRRLTTRMEAVMMREG